MKKTPLFLFTLLLFSFQLTVVTAQDSTESHDKAYLLNFYQENINNLRAKTANLSTEQLQYKPTPESWSVAQCLEHIALTETMLSGMVQAVMDQPANPEDRELLVASDEDVVNGVVDRSTKFKAPEVLQPEGNYTNAEEGLLAIINNRNKILEMIENNSLEDMRNRVADAPAGKIDGYQYLLFIAGHAERHSKQIDEIIASEGFPK
ncbi:DinB family protein [uncultured Planktosalinus sp.]|mgnify:FL=1|uniref:DinB family protein n=1 Tax=uncultured Planktosalinus sp. TaxID=1810935 RepID=UPI0030DCBDA9